MPEDFFNLSPGLSSDIPSDRCLPSPTRARPRHYLISYRALHPLFVQLGVVEPHPARIDTPFLCGYAEQWLPGAHLISYGPLRVESASPGFGLASTWMLSKVEDALGRGAEKFMGLLSTSKRLRIRTLFRLVVLPLLQAPEEALMGGQAVIEGVMMRSPHSYAVAVRQPSGGIVVAKDYLEKPSERHPWMKYPLLRGLGTLGQAMVLGIRALRYSAEQALEEPGKPAQGEKKAELSNWLLAANLAFSLGFFIFFYKYVPLSLATIISRHYPAAGNLLIFNLLDGTIRILLFLGFLFFISQWKEIRRIFEYHGAEHKVVWAFEKQGAIDVETARACTRFHPRCGTSFLLVVMAIAMVLYMFLPFRTFAMRFVGRLALLPVIAGVSYEFIRFAAKSQGKLWRWAAQPGLWLQRVTTREPDDSQLETAIKAIETAMELEKARGGELVVA